MNIRENQAQPGIALYQSGVDRQIVRIVRRGDTEHLVPGTHVTLDELHQYQLVGRRLQARATASAFASLFRALVWPLRKLAAAYTRVSREAAAIRRLRAMDDHLLRDIGIPRDQIPTAVAGLMARPADAEPTREAAVEPRRTDRRAASNAPEARAAA